MIQQCSPHASYLQYKMEIDDAIKRVLDSGYYILGKEVERFEREFAAYVGSRHCIAVANGTDAIELILRATGVKNGDLVVTTANTATATVSAIERCGAAVRFADIESDSFTMSPESLSLLLKKEPKVKMIIPVHLFGSPARLSEILTVANEFSIPLLEDCAQAHGASISGKKCGTFGIAGTFSFYPTKNLGALGDGGCIITDHDLLAERIYSLRQYGWKKRYTSEFSGCNSRLDEIQAAILSAKLPHLNDDNQKRIRIAASYTEYLKELPQLELPSHPENISHVFHQYVIKTENRTDLANYLNSKGIGTAIHYPVPIHQQPAYQKTPLPVPLWNTEKINDRILSLPMFPEMTECEIFSVTRNILDFYHAI